MLLMDEIGGRTYPLGTARIVKPVITVRELIAVRVDLELEAQREREADVRNRTASTLSARELQLNGADKALRPSLFQACREGNPVARERLLEAAEQGFVQNRFFVLLDDRQADSLDDTITIDRTGEVTFFLLTPLQGG